MAQKEEWLTKIRVTAQEKALFQQHAKADGLSLSSWVRMQLLRAVRTSEVAKKPKKK